MNRRRCAEAFYPLISYIRRSLELDILIHKTMKTQFVTDDRGEKLAVILPIKKYYKMLEEIEDIRMYDEVKAQGEETISFEEYLSQRNQNCT